ncbi:L,D-transpeptidase family protein [Aliihoeflea aestuarii]|uniref:L,D-transpeptidase family protein n=1 Tax=Aliihoeflea aestuarii TaxID=453840 RepID=UPI002095D6A1|nr:L,D-transpeptidase family protein [Aliihoeflea aestuarii]MCO6392702.1 L,D-transpeptidase family protein [Aliihoeflea aestuarii]
MKTSRRTFLTGAGALAAAALSQSAHAQNGIDSIIGASRRGWDDQFDAQGSSGGQVATTRPIFSSDTLVHVQDAIGQYQNIAANGGWPMVPDQNKLQLGVVHPDVEIMRRRLMISGDLSEQAGISPSFDTYVDAALKRFQTRHGIPADGVTGPYTYRSLNASADVRLGQLQRNLDRLGETVGSTANRYVMVNIPAAAIEAVEGGRVVSRHVAVVGKIDRQTPILKSNIHQIIVNPYWNAPESIVRRDIIPLVRSNPNYLEENGIRILGPNGQEVDPLTINWQTEEAARLRFRQDPGRINAMASVKIDFHNTHAVYMHDTPQQSLFADQERFHSSGCVRVQNVRDLVTWILRETPGWDRSRFEQTIINDADVAVAVTNPVQVHFSYVSAWSNSDGVVQFRDDIYALDGSSELQISSAT